MSQAMHAEALMCFIPFEAKHEQSPLSDRKKRWSRRKSSGLREPLEKIGVSGNHIHQDADDHQGDKNPNDEPG